MKELVTIQSKLKAPKGQFNSFGGYKYRSCEDILEAVKPLLAETGCILTLADDIVGVCARIYVKATATLTNSAGEVVITTAFAREEETKKGMDSSQITGAASSYARKYALNGLFAIDDTKDSDATNDHGKGDKKAKTEPKPAPEPPKDETLEMLLSDIAHAPSLATLTTIYNSYPQYQPNSVFMVALGKRKAELKGGK